MAELEWCLQVKKGIKLVEPNQNLAKGYEEKAVETLKLLKTIESASWRVVFAYYAIYYKVYSLLQELGIKSELHSCTIALLRFLGAEQLANSLEDMKKRRENAQYYVRKRVLNVKIEEVLKFFHDVDELREKLRGKESEIRKRLRDFAELVNTEDG